MSKKYDTNYYKITELYENATIGEAPDCVYWSIPADNLYDLMYRILQFLQSHTKEETFEVCLPCKLVPCQLYGFDKDKGE